MTVPVVLDYLLSHLGFFAVLPVLPVLLGRWEPAGGAVFVGAALFAFNFAVRGASLFISSLLHRADVRVAMASGLLMAAAGFAVLPVAPGAVGITAALLVAGAGMSTNGLMARVYVALSLETVARNTVFAAVQVAVNVSAALGPIAANFMLDNALDTPLLLAVAGTYVLAAAAVLVLLPRGVRPDDGDVRPPLRLGLLRAVVADPHVRRVSVITAAGGFLYAQFFSAVALQVAQVTDDPAWRAGIFTANAVLVVVLQIPVTAYCSRKLGAGTPPVLFLLVGVGTFAAAFALMGATGAAVAGMLAAVAVFSLAETFFTPMVNTAFSVIPGDRPVVELFNLRQVAATAGESVGAFTGGALFLVAAEHGSRPVYWGALAVVGAVVVLFHLSTPAREG
ncbi:MFS transporter [Actinokineospora bangkokensis]|uniref:Major facilitator superfamily (MFS) profile domain-containing protein n=1 Tax=Actinokineospora bangkokensis TaxID=1193682 RepID=A0A1Q9LRZ2_9PSEU|nr:MFS transporter [Actinokineospora bangkokensis]OLR94788.1 hypothetical protein BJP25_09115 [Actinokineospora bangkokensis]